MRVNWGILFNGGVSENQQKGWNLLWNLFLSSGKNKEEHESVANTVVVPSHCGCRSKWQVQFEGDVAVQKPCCPHWSIRSIKFGIWLSTFCLFRVRGHHIWTRGTWQCNWIVRNDVFVVLSRHGHIETHKKIPDAFCVGSCWQHETFQCSCSVFCWWYKNLSADENQDQRFSAAFAELLESYRILDNSNLLNLDKNQIRCVWTTLRLSQLESVSSLSTLLHSVPSAHDMFHQKDRWLGTEHGRKSWILQTQKEARYCLTSFCNKRCRPLRAIR